MALHRAPVDHRKVTLPKLTFISHLSPAILWLHSPLTSGTLIGLLTLSALHLERPTRGLKRQCCSPGTHTMPIVCFLHISTGLIIRLFLCLKPWIWADYLGCEGGHLYTKCSCFCRCSYYFCQVCTWFCLLVWNDKSLNKHINCDDLISNLWNY